MPSQPLRLYQSEENILNKSHKHVREPTEYNTYAHYGGSKAYYAGPIVNDILLKNLTSLSPYEPNDRPDITALIDWA